MATISSACNQHYELSYYSPAQHSFDGLAGGNETTPLG